jgi:hypothetical protein
MAKKKKDELVTELIEHYTTSSNDNDIRRTRTNGWNDTLNAYFGVLPDKWPYLSRVFDPLIRSAILRKTSRLINSKLRGTLVPREGGDVVKAKINNAVLDYQWDMADEGGSMIEKVALSDIQTRIFGASFGLVYWSIKEVGDEITYEGNELKILDNRDVFVDFTANHVKNANWVQVREFLSLQDLEKRNENSPEPIYTNLNELKDLMSSDKKTATSDRRDVLYDSITKEIRGLEDRVGTDRSFPTIEVVTEYRKDRWITFVPRFKLIIRDIDNPYDHKRIPIAQLRYYPVGDDVYGESEVESVLPLQRAANAMLGGFIDEMNLTMRPPIKVANNSSVRIDTLVYGPNAVWLTGDSVNNVQEHQSGNGPINNFQTVYPALKAAFNEAIGETTQGMSDIDPMGGDKTATEVKSFEKQKQSRDQYNQIYLEQYLKDIMMLWLENNQQFMFDDPTKHVQVLRVVGKDILNDMKKLGLDSMDVPPEAMREMRELISQDASLMTNSSIKAMSESLQVPNYPVIMNPNEKNPENFDVRPKLEMDETGQLASLLITPDDLDGRYDYIPDVKSMAVGSYQEQIQGRSKALELIMGGATQQMLAQEGFKIKVKDLLVDVFEDMGIGDGEKLFEQLPQQPMGMPQQGMPMEQGMMPQGQSQQPLI